MPKLKDTYSLEGKLGIEPTYVCVYIYIPRFLILAIQPNTNLDIPVKGSAGVIKVQKLWKASWLVDLIT